MPTDAEYASLVRERYAGSGAALDENFKKRMIEILVDGVQVQHQEWAALITAVDDIRARGNAEGWYRLDINFTKEPRGYELWKWKVAGSLEWLYGGSPSRYPLGNVSSPSAKRRITNRPARLIREIVENQLPVPFELRPDFERSGFRLQLQDDMQLKVDPESVTYGNNAGIPHVLGEAELYGVSPGVRHPVLPLAFCPTSQIGYNTTSGRRIYDIGVKGTKSQISSLERDLLEVVGLDLVDSEGRYTSGPGLQKGYSSTENFGRLMAGQRPETDALKTRFLSDVLSLDGREGLVPWGVMPDRRWGGIDSLDRVLGVHGVNKLAEDGRVGGPGELRVLLRGGMPLERVGNDLKISSRVYREGDFTKPQLAELATWQRNPVVGKGMAAQAVALEARYRALAIRVTFGLEGGEALWPLGVRPDPQSGADASFFEVLTRTGIDELFRGVRRAEPEEIRALEDVQFVFDRHGEEKVLRTEGVVQERQLTDELREAMMVMSAEWIGAGKVVPRPVSELPEGTVVARWPGFESLLPPQVAPVGAGAAASGNLIPGSAGSFLPAGGGALGAGSSTQPTWQERQNPTKPQASKR
ncbi:hypothetical protein [Streptomyces sp. NPDC047061]|uniref:hypothetical protein n=1 Tax=Streptomyces sp. NPDC047061 TaxID=3154605 RepID=UPI0033CACC9D